MAQRRVRGVTVYRSIIYGNTTVLLSPEQRGSSDHTHRWCVAVRSPNSQVAPTGKRTAKDQIGGGDDLSYFIKKVTFKLHETYSCPLRIVDRPPFEVSETGWGEFDIIIKIYFVPESGEKGPLQITHHLKLHPWPFPSPISPELALPPSLPTSGALPSPPYPSPPSIPGLVHSWQYEQILFPEPTEAFYQMLLSRVPTPLAQTSKHPQGLELTLGWGGNVGEFSEEMEREEGERLDEAKKNVLKEVQVLVKKLRDSEMELIELRRDIEEFTAANSVVQR